MLEPAARPLPAARALPTFRCNILWLEARPSLFPISSPGDSLGNVAMFDRNGKELWEEHIKSMIAQVCHGVGAKN